MKDEVAYQLPFGALGRLIQCIFVKRDIENIFDYRYRIIQNKFGGSLIIPRDDALNEEVIVLKE